MSTAKIWLTYAWKDNDDQEVDFIIQELEEKGLEVGFDRAKLLAGRRLWDQIDEHISDSELDAWAIIVTRNSLKSEPCQEELAYALDRSIRLKGSTFPLIGIFPEPLDRELIPSSLATRLYVTLDNNEWADKIVSAATQKVPARTIEGIPSYVSHPGR
ncbi:MAG: toll/interleukin-1 receptor domain-containing protein [Flavimaricola sp.]|nr:toll/interleukin-1 receptor domain-containing protein [Flavimaricola sp.]